MKSLLITLVLLPLTAGAITRTFDGGGADTNWSTTANWTPAAAPVAGDSLVFITGVVSSNNNITSGTVFRDLDFNARHSLTGNAFALTHGITASPLRGPNGVTIAQAITLGADQTFGVTSGTMICTGNVLLNGRQLTASVSASDTLVVEGAIGGTGAASRVIKTGAGTLRIAGFALNAGGLQVNAGILDVPGGIFSGNTITLAAGKITGNGTLPTLTATGGEIIPTDGDLSVTGPLTLGPAVKYTVTFTGPGAEDVLTVSGGAVDLGNAELIIDSSAYQPLWDEDFTILTKGTSGAITGTFKNLPQGAEIAVNATTFGRISYTGGNGNDVVLDIFSTTRQWDGGNTLNDNWDEADNWQLNIRPNFGDVLVFPSGIQSTDRGLDNNFPNDTTFRQLVFRGDDYTVRGNRFKLSHGINLAAGVTANLDTDVVLAQEQTFNFGINSILHLDLLDNIDTAGRTLTLTGGDPNFGGVSATLDGTISGTGGLAVVQNSRITLTARSTYTGTTFIEALSELRITKQSVTGFEATLGGIAGPTRIAGTLKVEDDNLVGDFTVEENLVLLNGGKISAVEGFTTDLTGSLTLENANSAEIDVVHPRLDISGPIQGQGNLTITRGEVHLKGATSNTFTGSLTVGAFDVVLEKSGPGVLAVPCEVLNIGPDANGSNSVQTQQDEQIADNCHVTVAEDGTLSIGNVTGRTETIGSLTMQGNSAILGTTGSASLLKLKGDIHASDGVSQFNFQPVLSVATEIHGTPCILDVGTGTEFITATTRPITRLGNASIRKTGPGKVRILDTITVPCEIRNGEFRFHGNGSGAPVTLNGGTLGGSGSCGSITSQAGGGTVNPGESSATGILTSGALAWNAATTLKIEITNTTAGTGHDRLVALGSVSLGGATLTLVEQPGFNVAIGGQVFPLLNDGTDATGGTFAGLPEGTFIPASTNGWRISYTGGDGNDVRLTRAVTPPVEVQPTVTTVTFGAPDVNGNRAVTIAGKGTPGASYRLENSINLQDWTLEGTAQTAAAGTGALNFTTSASPPVRLKQFWRFRKL